jgi:hypothetical protein
MEQARIAIAVIRLIIVLPASGFRSSFQWTSFRALSRQLTRTRASVARTEGVAGNLRVTQIHQFQSFHAAAVADRRTELRDPAATASSLEDHVVLLNGRFGDRSGRPYIQAMLFIPRLDIQANVSFLIEKGTGSSVLAAGDGLRMGIDFGKLPATQKIVGFGDVPLTLHEERAIVIFRAEEALCCYAVSLLLTAPGPASDVPSVLGREILEKWQVTIDQPNNSLMIRVRDADEFVSLDQS